MSMTVHIAVQGVTDLSILLEALGEMGIDAREEKKNVKGLRGRAVLAVAGIDGRKVGFTRNQKGELTMVGDTEWSFMKNEAFLQKLRQQCSLASVKRRAVEMGYRVASVTRMEDGAIKVLARAWG